MDRPSPSPGSTAGQSLVGTLIAFGLLLGMIMLGVSLAAATEARYTPTASLTSDLVAEKDCPANVLDEAPNPARRTCMTLTVVNDGDSSGTARCEITKEPSDAEARFNADGFSVYSFEIAAGAVEPLLIRVDGGGKRATELAGSCDLVPPRAT
jgi:hypothetical protein